MTTNAITPNAKRALEVLGKNLKMARLKRRISIKSFGDRVGVSESTVIRLEKGDHGVSVGTLAMACLVLGELERVSDFFDPASDNIGLLLDRETLPKRIDSKRKLATLPSGEKQPNNPSGGNDDDDGVGF
jgi:transcriptional regulator with XRE-family HTH domain